MDLHKARWQRVPVLVAAMVALALLSAGCSSGNAGAEQTVDDLLSGQRGKGDAAGSGSGGDASGEAAAPKAWSGPKKLKGLATGTSVVKDPAGDAQRSGEVPGFVEILEGSVQGLGDSVSLTLVMSGNLPARMPNDTTHMIVAWNLAGGKRQRNAGFSAQATTEGWQVTAAVAGEMADYPGSVQVSGNTIEFVFPWKFIKDPYKFDWSAASTWFSGSDDETATAADNITEGRYPAKKKG